MCENCPKDAVRFYKSEPKTEVNMPCPPTGSLSGEILYFQARESGTAYAFNTQAFAPHLPHQLGGRAALSCNCCHDGWELRIQGLIFHNRANDELKKPAFPTWIAPSQFSEPLLASSTLSRWRLHLGWVDLLLTRPFPWITPYFGLKGAGVRQKSRIDYFLTTGRTEELSMKQKFWGIGPVMGVSSSWNLGHHFSLYGQAAASLLFGSFYLHQDEEEVGNRASRLKLLNRFALTRAILEAKTGLSYRYCLERAAFAIRVGWEIDLLPGQNLAMNFTDQSPGHFISNLGDLSLQGWTFALSVDF